MNKRDYVNREERSIAADHLLSTYLNTHDIFIFLLLYDLVNNDLYNVLRNPLRYSSLAIRKRREYFLIHTSGSNRYFEMLNKIKESFIADYCSFEYKEINIRNKSLLLSPFWESVQNLTPERAFNQISSWGIDSITYLQSTFCDYYWSYVQKQVIRYYSKNSIIKSVISEEYNINSKGDIDSINLLDSVPSIAFPDPEDTYLWKELIEEIKKELSPTSARVLDLLLLDYKHKDIARMLGISESNSRKYKTQIKKAYLCLVK